jgi:hypothetical protein
MSNLVYPLSGTKRVVEAAGPGSPPAGRLEPVLCGGHVGRQIEAYIDFATRTVVPVPAKE